MKKKLLAALFLAMSFVCTTVFAYYPPRHHASAHFTVVRVYYSHDIVVNRGGFHPRVIFYPEHRHRLYF
jgi:hypothetical protein